MNIISRWLSTSCQFEDQNTTSSHWDISSGDGMGQTAGVVKLECLTIVPRNRCMQKATTNGAHLVNHLFWIAPPYTISQNPWGCSQLATCYKPATDLARGTTLGSKGTAEKWWIICTEMQTKLNLKWMILLQKKNLKRKIKLLSSICIDNTRSRVCFEWYHW